MDAKSDKRPHVFRKLTKDLIHKILFDIEEGSPHKYAAEANGVSESIFNIWRKQGAIDLSEDLETLPSYLVVSLAKIKQNEVKDCRLAIKSSDKGHKGAEWTLEHAYWRHFGSNAAVMQLAQDMEEFKSTFLKGKSNVEVEDKDKKQDA